MAAAVAIIDSHCHLDDRRFEPDREAVLERAREVGIEAVMTIGTGEGPPRFDAAIRLADRYERVYATVGVHPHDAAKADGEALPRLEELSSHPKVLAIGEMGLDYYYDNSPREAQRAVFQAQLALARRLRKPVIIHTRDAWDETFAILADHWAPSGLPGIMHCFSGGPAEAERALAMGFYVSFSGIVTYPKAPDVQEAAQRVPADRILVETDAPYLAPVPHRGKRNEPALVVETAKKLAELRGQSFEEIAAVTTANFRRVCLPWLETNG